MSMVNMSACQLHSLLPTPHCLSAVLLACHRPWKCLWYFSLGQGRWVLFLLIIYIHYFHKKRQNICTAEYFIFYNFMIFSFFFLFFIVVQVELSPFSPLSSPLPIPTSHPQSSPPLSISPLYMFLDDPSPSFPCYPPPHSPLVTVSSFFISVYLVLFCSLVCFVD